MAAHAKRSRSARSSEHGHEARSGLLVLTHTEPVEQQMYTTFIRGPDGFQDEVSRFTFEYLTSSDHNESVSAILRNKIDERLALVHLKMLHDESWEDFDVIEFAKVVLDLFREFMGCVEAWTVYGARMPHTISVDRDTDVYVRNVAFLERESDEDEDEDMDMDEHYSAWIASVVDHFSDRIRRACQ